MEEKILKVLAEKGAMRPGDIATAAGIDKDEAGKVIKQLAKEGKIYSPKRCFYDIKKSHRHEKKSMDRGHCPAAGRRKFVHGRPGRRSRHDECRHV